MSPHLHGMHSAPFMPPLHLGNALIPISLLQGRVADFPLCRDGHRANKRNQKADHVLLNEAAGKQYIARHCALRAHPPDFM